MSLADVPSRFGTAAADGIPSGYPVTRTAQGGYNSAGIAIAGAVTTFTLTGACVQPFSGRGITDLPSGTHAADVRVIDSQTPLMTVGLNFQPDAITIAGEIFVVYRVDGPFTLSGVSMWTAYAARVVTP